MKSLFSRSLCLVYLVFAALPALAQKLDWIRQFGTSTGEFVSGAVSDGAGGVFVSGYTQGSLGGTTAGLHDVWLARYDSAGNRIWIRQFGTSGYDEAMGAAPDGSGGVYVTGHSNGSLGGPNAGGIDAWLARYDGAGTQTWIRQLGTSANDIPWKAAPDGSGGVYVSGETAGSLGGPSAGSSDAWLARYDSTGNQTWIRQLGTSSGEFAGPAAPDGSGGVYVSGGTGGSLGGPNAGGADVWLARYDGAGNQTWIRQLGTGFYDNARGAAADESGGVYVSGSTDGSLGGPSAGSSDAWLARYDSSGNQTWIRQLGTSSDEGAAPATADGSGGVYVGGDTSGSLGGPNAGIFDAWLARYVDATTPFCTAKSGLSCGTPQIDASGIPSASATSGFVIRAGPARSCKSGILLYNTTSLAAGVPFQGGTLCVTPSQVRRGGPTNSGGTPGGTSCDGEFALDMNAFAAGAWLVPDCAGLPSGLAPNSPAAYLLSAGQDVYCQFWGRDSLATGSFVSAGLQYTVEP